MSAPQILVAAGTDEPALSRPLKPRHISMITIGGIIGAGLFVGSSVAIAAVGPAVILSYLLTGTLVLLDAHAGGDGGRDAAGPLVY